jgi:hypothetical protein
MNQKRGYYTLNIGSKKRTMHFSMNFWATFTDMLGVNLDKIGDIFMEGISISALRALFYAGLLAYDQENKNEIDYTEFDVGNWLEDINAEEIEKIVGVLAESKILGSELGAVEKKTPKKK